MLSCTDNARYLQLDAERLELGNAYLKLFYERAADLDADVATGKP